MLVYKGTRFDDHSHSSDDDYDYNWSQICHSCALQHGLYVEAAKHDCPASLICGVEGCEDDADFYIDFDGSETVEDEALSSANVRDWQELEVSFKVIVNQEDIDDIMCAALEGGITYWCCKAEVVGEYLGNDASDQISRGGSLMLHDSEEDKVYELTLEKFLSGLKLYLARPTAGDFLEFIDHELRIDTGYADAEVADSIIQYAIFGDVIYG